MKQEILPEILNSRNERVILELPNYTYCHSSQTKEESQSFFIGRKSLLLKLKNLISTSASKTGVYLVTGNRGVGKSRLVEEVIKETTLKKYSISDYFRILFITFLLTIGAQFFSNSVCEDCSGLILLMLKIFLALILFIIIGHNSKLRLTSKYEYSKKRKESNSKNKTQENEQMNPHKKKSRGINSIIVTIIQSLVASFKDCLILPSKAAPFLRTQNVLKLIFIIIIIDCFAELNIFTHFQLLLIYLSSVLGYFYIVHSKQIFIKELWDGDRIIEDWRFKNNQSLLKKAFKKNLKFGTFLVIALSIATTSFIIKPLEFECVKFLWFLIPIISVFLILCVVFGVHYYLIKGYLEKGDKNIIYLFWVYLCTQISPLFKSIDHYIKNSSHVYLKINFGHDVLNEYDILRLITRTLTSEYRNFRKSIMHTLHWRFLALALLLSCTYLFYEKIYKPDIQPWIAKKTIYEYSSQEYFNGYHSHIFLSVFLKNKKKNIIDKAANRLYCYIIEFPTFLWSKGDYNINFNHTPINYAWWLIFLSFYLLGCLLLRLNFFTSHYTIRNQLKRLNDNITYSIEREYSFNSSFEKGNLMANIGIKKRKTRFIADAREIEKELQDILINIQKIPLFLGRPDFVIVFDELDKVSPETPIPVKESETKNKEKLFSSNSTTERQAVILKLLSNMKYFLSTAYAKFIFIAGREMYDMYLADIADRNNYFGSIFNDVLFVPSLLTDVKSNKRQYDITTLVEEYVCRRLIPEDYPTSIYNLKEYIKYLDNLVFHDNKEIEMKKQKIIATLQQFIIYLAHTSKGAPKKMAQIFESFVESYDNRELIKRNLIVKRFHNSELFLDFDYYAQYTIGMTSYIMTPVIKRMSDANIQEHSDKLFVSTLHFVDYMMKFHGHNFSWRNIDISPELIEINRSPVLKAIVNDVVTLFEQIHFHKPVISLFEFKFDALLAQEIFFLSKMDERFSAQFNFSLDESLILKDYYKKLLKEKQSEYEKYRTYGDKYVSSIASLHIVLGDLHFFDDELDVAALYYKDGLYLLQKQLENDNEKENLEIFYLYIRNQLKLAYLYEKRKQNDFAYLLYGDLTSLLVQYRDFDLEEKGISIRREDKDFFMVRHSSGEKINPYNKNIETPLFSPLKDSYIYAEKTNWINRTKELEKQKQKANIRSMKFEQLSPVTQQILFKNMTFEGLQLIYLPLLAKLQILEKCSIVGILKKDIELVEIEFEFITRTINLSEVKILAADFYSKIGDILFYKNKVFSSLEYSESTNYKSEKKIDISHYPCLYYQKALIAMIEKKGDKDEKNTLKAKPILEIIKDNIDNIESKLSVKYRAMIAKIFSNLGDTYFQAQEEQCKCCEFNKSDCEGTSFSLVNPDNHISDNEKAEIKKSNVFWEKWLKFMFSKEINESTTIDGTEEESTENKNTNCFRKNKDYSLSDFIKAIKPENKSKLTNIEYALLSYSISMKFYKKANRNKHYAFQIEKILNCLKYCLRYNIHTEEIKRFFKGSEEKKGYGNLDNLVNKAIHSLYIAYDNINMHEINKRRADFDKFNKAYHDRDIALQYIQVDSEISRIRIIAKELELELVKNEADQIKSVDETVEPKISNQLGGLDEEVDETSKTNHSKGKIDKDVRIVEIVKNLYANYITSPYQINSSVTARVHRLRMKAILNMEAYEIMKNEFREVFTGKFVISDPQKTDLENLYNDNLYIQFLTIMNFGQDEVDKKGDKGELWEKSKTKIIFDCIIKDETKKTFLSILEMLIADSIFCLEEILRLIKTAGDSYLFNHSFFASIYYRLSIWTTKYDILQNIGNYFDKGENCKNNMPEKFFKALEYFDITFPDNDDGESKIKQLIKNMKIDKYLEKNIGVDFKEQLSSHYYREQALAHYYKTIDTHNGGRAYLNLLEQMYFIKGDYDDVTSHFYVALERFLVNNSNEIQDRIKDLKDKGEKSSVYNVNNYFEKCQTAGV